MLDQQKQFYDFILERGKADKQEELKQLLSEAFERQTTGGFTLAFFDKFNEQLAALLKPEYVNETAEIVKDFQKRAMNK